MVEIFSIMFCSNCLIYCCNYRKAKKKKNQVQGLRQQSSFEAILCSMEVTPIKDWESTQASPSSILFDVLDNNEQVDENDATIIKNFIDD